MAKRTESEKQAIDAAMADLPPRPIKNNPVEAGQIGMMEGIQLIQDRLQLVPPFDIRDWQFAMQRRRRSR